MRHTAFTRTVMATVLAVATAVAGQAQAFVFTDGDLRRLVTTQGADALETPVATVMTARPVSLTVDALVRDAVRLVQERRLDRESGGAS